ncbi:hypothetical protein DPX16_5365 [Anabarilius grahami]|uniref:Uncharacterized protein n=1 Tax=Anabarilius grahami TaxID=495550 RepID=A0A3N0XPT2_ANAGA|nr:hypothetical protein DPX16_5365 [Anabarilius grahami]
MLGPFFLAVERPLGLGNGILIRALPTPCLQCVRLVPQPAGIPLSGATLRLPNIVFLLGRIQQSLRVLKDFAGTQKNYCASGNMKTIAGLVSMDGPRVALDRALPLLYPINGFVGFDVRKPEQDESRVPLPPVINAETEESGKNGLPSGCELIHTETFHLITVTCRYAGDESSWTSGTSFPEQTSLEEPKAHLSVLTWK